MRTVFKAFGSLLLGTVLVTGSGKSEKSLALDPIDQRSRIALTEKEFLNSINNLYSGSYSVRQDGLKKLSTEIDKLLKKGSLEDVESFIRKLQAEACNDRVTLEIQRRIGRLIERKVFDKHFKENIEKLDYRNEHRINYVSTLVRLGIFNNAEDRDYLLWNLDKLTEGTFDYLIKTGNESEKISIAFYSRTFFQAIEKKLSIDPIDNVRAHLARNENIMSQTFIDLSKDKSDNVRYMIVRNPKKPVQILIDLENDPSPYVRRAIAEETKDLSVARRLLDGLAKEKDPFLRGVVANNRNTRRETLLSLIDDPDLYVRTSARKNLGIK